MTSNSRKQENSCSPRGISCLPSEGRAQVGALWRSRAAGIQTGRWGAWGLRMAHTAAEAEGEFQELLYVSRSTGSSCVVSEPESPRTSHVALGAAGGCPGFHGGGKFAFPHLLFYSGPSRMGCCPPALGRATLLSPLVQTSPPPEIPSQTPPGIAVDQLSGCPSAGLGPVNVALTTCLC